MRLLGLLIAFAVPGFPQPPEGAEIYRATCAQCHDGSVERAPRLEMLRQLGAQPIVDSLENGAMRLIGIRMTPAARRAAAAFISGAGEKSSTAESPVRGLCGEANLPDGKRLLVAGQKSGWLHAVDPDRGGAINGPGPVIVDGMLYVNSGYALFGTMPGNVLLAFSVDGE